MSDRVIIRTVFDGLSSSATGRTARNDATGPGQLCCRSGPFTPATAYFEASDGDAVSKVGSCALQVRASSPMFGRGFSVFVVVVVFPFKFLFDWWDFQ